MANGQKYPPKEDDWKTANQMRSLHGGHDQTWNRHMREYAELRTAECAITHGISHREAAILVDKTLAGWRMTYGKKAFAISPTAEKELLALLPTPLEKNWQTAIMVRNELGGSDTNWRQQMEHTRDALIGDVHAGLKIRIEDAERLVDDHIAGDRKPVYGPATLAIGPDAKRVMLDQLFPRLPEGWRTDRMMEADIGIVNIRAWKRRMEKLAESLTEKAQGDGMTQKEAELHVQTDMVGVKIDPQDGTPRIAASPEAQEILKRIPNRKRGSDGPAR